ncbi:MAG: hypothetical protein UZ22_OP11002001079 [Microgenomates bacterium OLB23]|nr:MAG: hypothetical protein UZ22_OP11002001079 [Microgenomates bacterium OLB23]
MTQRIVQYASDPDLGDFLPNHLRAAAGTPGITIVEAYWHPYSGRAYVVTEGIDLSNPAHVEIGRQAEAFTRQVVDSLPPPEELEPIDYQ